MTTRVPHPAALPPPTPGAAAPAAGAGTAVPAPAGAVPSPGAAAPTEAPTTKGVVVALETLVTGLRTLSESADPYLQDIPSGTTVAPRAVTAERLRAMPLLAALVRANPGLGTVDEANAIDAGVEAGVAARTAINLVEVLLSRLKATEHQAEGSAWIQASVAYASGQARARTDGSLAVALTPIRTALRRGPRAVTSAARADAQQQKAAAAQQRAVKAQQRAEVATRAATRATQAHADAHPTSARAIPVAGSPGVAAPGSNPQGPSASVPLVNPQGPAPGR